MTFDEQYHPCRDGFHVMHLDDDAEHGPHVTLANYRVTGDAAKLLFLRLRDSFADPESDEMLLDLLIDGSLEDGFCFRRQMLERVTTMIAESGL